MAHPASISAASGRSEPAARGPRAAMPSQDLLSGLGGEALAADVPGAAGQLQVTGSDADLAQLGGQFAGLTRLLDEIYTVGETLPSAEMAAMLAPASGVLTGVMDRIIGTPAATPADLGLKAQVVCGPSGTGGRATHSAALFVTLLSHPLIKINFYKN